MAYEAIVDGKSYKDIENLPIRERIGRFKYTPEQDIKSVMSSIHEDMMIEFDSLKKE
jgi:V/A-type H+-transporting ATPase subunit A